MSECTDVNKHLEKNAGNTRDFWRLVRLIKWHLTCLTKVIEKDRGEFPYTQEDILFKEIKKQIKELKSDLIQLDIKNLKLFATGLSDYEVRDTANLKKFLVESLLSCCISMSEEILKIRDENVRDKIDSWQKSCEAVKADNGTQFLIVRDKKAKIDRYLITRRDVESLKKIVHNIELLTIMFEINKLPIWEKTLVLQKTFRATGEYLKDTPNTPNLSSDVRQSLEKSGLPATRLSKHTDRLNHNQLYPFIETDDNQVNQLYDDFLIIENGIRSTIIEIEYRFIKQIREESEIDEHIAKVLTDLIRKKGFEKLNTRIVGIRRKPLFSRSKFMHISENAHNLKFHAPGKSWGKVSTSELSTTYFQLISIPKHISQSLLNLYDKLRDLVAPYLEIYVGPLKNPHDDILKQQQVIDLLSYKGTSSPNETILEKFLSQPILDKVILKNNRSLKAELGLYFDAESFKNGVNYAKFKDSYPEMLNNLLRNNISESDDNKHKLIKFFELKPSNNENQDNELPPEEYERWVKDLPTDSYEIKEKLLLYSVEWRKKKCVDLLEKNFPALKTIYDNILEGKLTHVSTYIELACQYEHPKESEIALKQKPETLNDYIKQLYSKRVSEEFGVLGNLKNIFAVESQIINVYSLYGKYKPGGDSYQVRRLRNYLSRDDDPFDDKEIRIDFGIIQIKEEFVRNFSGPLTPQKIKSVLDKMPSKFGIYGMVELICPATQSGKHASASCLTWEEINEVSEREAENKHPDHIRIDSEKFISKILSGDFKANEEKLSTFIALASHSEVIGKHKSKVNMLIDNPSSFGHLQRVGKVSGMFMHGMFAKNQTGALLSDDCEDVAETLSILAVDTGLQKAAEVASVKEAGYIKKSRALFGNSLRLAAPFLSRGVSTFIAWDLYKQVKEYTKGDTDALVAIVGDSLQLGVDASEIGIETGEVYGLLEGVSAAIGPKGMTLGAIVFVGTDVFKAVRPVKKIDEYIHLRGLQKLTEGICALLGEGPSCDIELLIDVKRANDQAVKRATCFLKDNPHIRRYVFPSMKMNIIESNVWKEIKRKHGNPVGMNNTHSVTLQSTWVCDNITGNSLAPALETSRTDLREVSNNELRLDKEEHDIKGNRTKPGNVEGIDLYYLHKGNWESVPEERTYTCHGAIGIEYRYDITGNYTWTSFRDSEDMIKGFQDSNNIIVVGDRVKLIKGGNRNDNFIFGGKGANEIKGCELKARIDGGGGIDAIDVSGLTPHYEWSKKVGTYQIVVDFRKGFLVDRFEVALIISNINVFLGRRGGADNVTFACDTMHVDGRGGENKNDLDSIIIPKDNDCYYNTIVTVNPYTRVTNNALAGNFLYIVKGEKGKEAHIEVDPRSQSDNTIVFDYTLTDVADINKSEKNITFSFVEEFYKREKTMDVNSSFNLTVSGADKNTTTYQLIDHTKIIIGRNNVYALRNTEEPIDCLAKDYSSIADKSQMYVVVHSNDEVLVAGHSHADILRNDPNARASHLVGGGGENVFVISSGHEKLTLANLPISDVVIYDFDQEDKIDSLDLREIKEQLKKDIDREINAEISKSFCDLLINLSLDDASKKEVVKITLKGALKNNWYKRIHIVIGNIFVIKEILGDFELTPQPLIFDDNSKTIYAINSTNVEKGSKIRVNKEIGQYSFARDNDTLVITKFLEFSSDEYNAFAIILNDFYYGNNRYKMQSLKIEFDDKTILLRKEIERINSAENLSELMWRGRVDSYKAAVYAIMIQKQSEAIEGNNTGEVKKLIDHGVRFSPFYVAALISKLEVVKYLVEETHADVNVKDNYAITPLHYAALGGNLEMVKYLVEQKHAGVNVRDSYGYTPLHVAVLSCSLRVVKYLVWKGADVNLKDNIGPLVDKTDRNLWLYTKFFNEHLINPGNNKGMTPLSYAVNVCNLEMVKYLIEKGAKIDIKYESKALLNILEDTGYKHVVDSIVKELTDRLFDAVKYDDLDEVQDLLNQGVSVNVRSDRNETILHYFASKGKLKVLKYLIEQKHANVNAKDYDGVTPLRRAVTNANLEVVKYLVGKGANVNQKDIDAANGNLEMKNYLKQIRVCDSKGRPGCKNRSPFGFAVAGNYSSRRLNSTDSCNQTEIATSNASEKYLWKNDLVGSIVKSQESSAPSETASSNHPIRHERRERYNDHSRHERNVKYQDSHYYIDQSEIAASSGTRPSSWINGLVDWIKEIGGELVSSMAGKFAAKESEDPKSRVICASSVRLEQTYNATILNIPQSRKSQGVPKGNISNTSWSGWSSNREKVTSNVTDTPEMNTTVLNNALILGDLAVRLINGTRQKQPVHENLLSPREKSMRFIDENMIMRTIQQGKEKFGGLATNMDEEQDWNWEISG